MRMMLKIKFSSESGNRAAKDGSMAEAFQALKEKLKPKATYLSMEDGMRCAYIFYDAKTLPEFVKIHEPLIQATGALVYDAPALTWDDIGRGLQRLLGEEGPMPPGCFACDTKRAGAATPSRSRNALRERP